MSDHEAQRETWPFATLLPWSVMYNYPPPQYLPKAIAPQPSVWPPAPSPDFDAWRAKTGQIATPAHQIYVHVPFCPFICDFCPFYKVKSSRRGCPRAVHPHARSRNRAQRPGGGRHFARILGHLFRRRNTDRARAGAARAHPRRATSRLRSYTRRRDHPRRGGAADVAATLSRSVLRDGVRPA